MEETKLLRRDMNEKNKDGTTWKTQNNNGATWLKEDEDGVS